MKIAFISDIHGNLLAFESVLKDIKKARVDQIVFLGDASDIGMRPAETLDLLKSLNCECVMGNHDEFMINPKKLYEYTKDKLVIDTVEWSRARHTADHLKFISTFKPFVQIPLVSGVDIFCYHGSPTSNMENVRPDTGLDSFSSRFVEKGRMVFIGGHTHVQMIRNVKGTRIVTAGSVGQPFVGYTMPPTKHPWAEYAVISSNRAHYSIELRQVPIDNDRINKEILASDSPMNDFISTY